MRLILKLNESHSSSHFISILLARSLAEVRASRETKYSEQIKGKRQQMNCLASSNLATTRTNPAPFCLRVNGTEVSIFIASITFHAIRLV